MGDKQGGVWKGAGRDLCAAFDACRNELVVEGSREGGVYPVANPPIFEILIGDGRDWHLSHVL